jgi:hypothetical protein
MPPAGFEPTITVSERPQTHVLDRAAIGIGLCFADPNNFFGPVFSVISDIGFFLKLTFIDLQAYNNISSYLIFLSGETISAL